VLVVERADAPGGYARPIRHGSYTADLAVSELPTGVENELIDGIFAHLGVRDRCVFEPVDGFYRAVLPDLELDVPLGLDAFVECHAASFPAEADGFRRLVELCAQLLQDVHGMPMHIPLDRLDEVAAQFPTLFRYASATLAEVLDELLTDPRAKAALAVSWPQAGLPPERLSFATFAQGVALYADGMVAPRGGLGAVVDALADVLGDRLVLGREAVRIVLADGRVAGIELEGGERLATRAVVSAGDARRALAVLVGTDALPPRLVRRLERLRPSVSAFVLVAAAPDHGALPRLTFLHDESGARWLTAREGVVVVRALAASEDAADSLAGDLERLAPGARVLTSLGPSDLERLTGNTGGAAFGWENSPQQTGSRRLPIVTPVEGLFLAGHWAQPGHGAYRAILSGMHAARAVLDRDGRGAAIPEFRST
jgi:phytoene dehydrogenase-like protein